MGEVIVFIPGLFGGKLIQIMAVNQAGVLAGLAPEFIFKPAREDEREKDLPKLGVFLAGIDLLGELRQDELSD